MPDSNLAENLPDLPDQPGQVKNNTTPIEKLILWRNQGLTYEQIGKLDNVTKQTVHERLKPYNPYLQSLATFKENKIDVIELLQNMLLSSLTPDDIKEMSVRDRITSAAILIDKQQVLEGKSGGSDGKVTVTMNFNTPNNTEPTVIIDNE